MRDPILFQGGHKKRDYFEGWYYKQVTADCKTVLCVIPGVSLFEGDPHCFVQYIMTALDHEMINVTRTGFVRYPIDRFSYGSDPFYVQIGENHFTADSITLNLTDADLTLQGTLHLKDLLPIKTSLISPDIMGPFAYLPFMECYHGVISMKHGLEGHLRIQGKPVDFTGGSGYMEKDWGRSFPSRYIWLQSHHFSNPSASLMASVAAIPFLNGSFTGFIANMVLEGKEYRFATYNGSKLERQKVTDEEVHLSMTNRKAELSLKAFMDRPGELIAPVKGQMTKSIKEGITGQMHLKLRDFKSGTCYEDTGKLAGIEVVGFTDQGTNA